MSASPRSPLDIYRHEVLRWNTQISLISRYRPEERLNALLRQCAAAREALLPGVEALSSSAAQFLAGERLAYIDLGSGAGLPGLPWRMAAVDRPPVATWLVEPRAKRACFLERTVRCLGLEATWVQAARWGEMELQPPCAPSPDAWLITLMALRLSDPEVLAGLKSAAGPWVARRAVPVVIARVRQAAGPACVPPAMKRALGLPGDERCRCLPCGKVGAEASLLISLHAFSP